MSVPAGCGSGRRELLRAEQAELSRVLGTMAALARTASALAASVQQRLAEELEQRRRREVATADAELEAALKWMQRTAEQLQIELLLPPDGRPAVVCVPPDATVADLWTAVHDAGGPPPVLQELAVGGRRLPRAGWRLLRDTGLVRAGARIAVSQRDLRARRFSVGDRHAAVLLDSGELRCFGDEDCWSPVPDFSPGSVTSVHTGYGYTAAVVAGKVVAWGKSAGEHSMRRLEGRSIVCFKPGALASMLSRAVDADGRLLLWRSAGDHFGETPDSLDGRVAAADVMESGVGGRSVVVLTRGGAVLTLTESTRWVYDVVEVTEIGRRTALSVSAGVSHYAVLLDDGSVRCYGSRREGRCDVPVGLRGVVSCAAWSDTTFALLDDGSFHCWGLSQDDDPIDTQSLRDAVGASGCVDIEFARWMVSVVTADGRLLCDDGTSYRL
eukprot:TRINITY_DN487_c1_g1_i5.p1 TRINITY_DN487_c1_g1~~TRINITY_DN487_c1_g1_i5.p1  ORF type:complete len:441 (+),score=146.35 TRINITY_DN487_c1_g1_i5:82-1404(+)